MEREIRNMKVQKYKRRKYREWWKNHLGYDFDEELRIYKYLCEIRVFRKPPINGRFTSYQEWEEYIRLKYKEVDVDTLQTFYCYLVQKERNTSVSQGINHNFMLPVMAALITGCLIPSYTEWEKVFSETSNLPHIVQYASYLCIGMLFSFCIFYIIWLGINAVYNRSDEYYFYKDYQEIIQQLIEEKQSTP